MTRLLCAAAAIALIAPTGAIAQRHHDRNDNKTAAAQQQPQRQRQDRHANNRPSMERQKGRHETVQRTTRMTTDRGHAMRGSNRTMNSSTMRTRTRTNVYRVGHRPSSYHRIRAATFVYPSGYHYRHWGIGAVLPRLFLSNSYFWTDWSALGLLPPPPGFVWIRYGPDLLLVNRYNGRIADVIYGAFF